MDFPIFLIIFAVSKQLKTLIMEIQDLMAGDLVRYKKSKETIFIFEVDADRGVINNELDGYCSERNIEINDVEPIPLTNIYYDCALVLKI